MPAERSSSCELQTFDARVVAHRDHKHVAQRRRDRRSAAQILNHDHALNAHAEADAGKLRPAQLLNQSVVAPAAADGEIAVRAFR